MKKVIAYMLVIVLMISGLICFTGCGNTEENIGIEEDNKEITSSEDEKKVVTSGDYTKWPSGVYDAYEIPEYTGGTISFAVPYSENGEVYINTDITSLRSYIYLLTAKDFKISESDLEELKEYDPMDEFDVGDGLSGTIYAPTKGAGYTLSYSYYGNGSKQTVPAYSFESVTEEYTYESNCLFSLNIEEYPEENIESNLLTEYGLTNEDILPKFKVYVAESDKDNPERAIVYFDFGYDSNKSQEEVDAYKLQITNACEKASDDGKIYDYNGENVISADDDKKANHAFVYKYQGVEYRVICEVFAGLGGNGFLRVETK